MSVETVEVDSREAAGYTERPPDGLPLRYSLTWAYLASLLIVLLTAVASLAGILYPGQVYPTAEARHAFLANDVVNLLIGVPIILLSMWLARRGKLLGLLFWPGAVLYGLYNYLVYLFGIPLNALYPLFLLIVTLSLYTTIALVAAVDGNVVKGLLAGGVRERLAGGVLTAFGVLFAARALAVMIAALAGQATIAPAELGLLVADFILSGALIIGGILLWRRQALGYVSGMALLFQASMLFVGLIAVLILQPIVGDTPFSLVDVLVVLAMSMVCFVPFALFMRGVVRS